MADFAALEAGKSEGQDLSLHMQVPSPPASPPAGEDITMNMLSDNGASNSCFVTLSMAIKGTELPYDGPKIKIGKEQASLSVNSSHAFFSKVTDDAGNQWLIAQRGFYTPDGLCNIDSEVASRRRGDSYIDNVPTHNPGRRSLQNHQGR